MENLLFSLVRLSITPYLGNNELLLSSQPSADEWRELYKMAVKQSLAGVCFVGVKKYMEVAQQSGEKINIPQKVYFQWLGTAAHIQQQNERMNLRCLELQSQLSSTGFKSSILKGQAISALYGDLSEFRQPGDIDIYVDCDRKKAIEYARSIGQKSIDWDYKHLHLMMFNDTEVEMHYRPEVLLNLLKNRRLQRWFAREETQRKMFCQQGDLVAPSVEFNLFYIQLHIYRHFLYEGVGLRQLMDYFFVLMAVDSQTDTQWSKEAIEMFGMKRFARGIMWIMQNVFGLENEFLLYESDEKEGRYILNQVMRGGNFGHHDERLKVDSKHSAKQDVIKKILKHNLHLLAYYPMEVVWAPVWIVYHWCWKRWVR